MTRISRKIIGWILGAFACIAIAFGIMAARPQMKTASAADVSVTFSAAVLGDASDATYGTSIRFDTSSALGVQWSTNHNWVKASDWKSIADYTTVNGRTVTEINNATTHTQKITLMMQPYTAQTCSFLRLYIPTEVIPLGEVKAMGILDGWSFNNGTNNYTSSAVSFLRNGDTMLKTDAYSAETKLAASDIAIGEAQLVNPKDANLGTDSYTVNIDIGQQIVTAEYDTMYGGYKTIRNSIYINGKSIEEWNAQKIAEDARFKDPAMYTTFPQNSDLTVYPSHADVFIKPVCLWATSTGFRLSIFQELVADCETVTVTVGQGCMFAGKFMVSETKSATVLTQQVVDITNRLSIQDFGTADGTEMYRIKTDSAAWTKAPWGGCLNEYDPSSVGGGQIQMKYLYLGDKDFWYINKNDDEAYGSTQSNIAGGGIYAPILVEMGQTEGYSYVQIRLPSAYPNMSASADVNHSSFTIKKGFNVAENGVSYYTTNDVVFTNDGASNWTAEVKPIEIETEVTGIVTKANRPDADGVNIKNENFVIFQLSNNDYAGLNTTAITDISSLYGYIDIGGTVIESYSGEKYFNVWNIQDSIAFRAPGLDAAALQNVEYITIKAGAKFPSYNTQYNGAPLTYYVTSEDVTFIHDVPNDTWTVGTLEHTVTYTVDGSSYHTETVASGSTATAPTAPTKAEDENYTYTFDCWTLNGVEYDFSTAVTSDITLVAEFTATQKGNTVDITAGLNFVDQGDTQSKGTDTYLIKTSVLAWTNTGTGRVNLDYAEQLEYIYFNGRAIAEINAESDDAYGSEFNAITSYAACAPIAVLYNKLSETSSYLQIWVPTGYPNLGATAEQNHQSIEIKEGFSITQGSTTWVVSEDIKWINLNGSWVNAETTFAADTVTIDNPRIEGTANELYKVDITSSSWNITCNNYDFMEASYSSVRDYIFINGRSINDINDNTDDSAYTYSTWPMTGTSGAQFVQPILIETHNGDGDPNTITLWIHKNYVHYLGDDFTVTLGKGYNKFTNNGFSLAEDVSAVIKLHKVTVDGVAQYVLDGNCAAEPAYPTHDMTDTEIFFFEDWYIVGTEDLFVFNTPITADMKIESRFYSNTATLFDTKVIGIEHKLKTSDDNWLIFELTEHDYMYTSQNYSLGGYDRLVNSCFLNNVILKGTIQLGSVTVSEASLMDVYKAYGALEGPLLNLWAQYKFGIRLPVGSGVEEIVLKEGCAFPAYQSDLTYYRVRQTTVYKYSEDIKMFVKAAAVDIDIQMAEGASVRVTTNDATSGIRFETQVAVKSVEDLYNALVSGVYTSVEFGTLIIPTESLVGGFFTHEWLKNNGITYLDITSTAGIDKNKTAEEGFASFAEKTTDYYSYFGSIVQLKNTNYGRYFTGMGYVKLTDANGKVTYIYADYTSTNSRSASFVANAAINDRSATEVEGEYDNYISANNNYSPYTASENTFLEKYLVWSESLIEKTSLSNLASKGGTQTVSVGKATGPYVQLVYSTNVNVWGVFTYTDGTTTVNEDFYLQAGTSEHKQYLDLFRSNAVGKDLDLVNGTLSMTSITFTNAELNDVSNGEVILYGLYSQNKTIDTDNQQIYVSLGEEGKETITVGAHLGLGGSLTYLAKAGIYEGVVGQTENGWWDQNVNDYTKYVYNTGSVVLSTDTSVFDDSHATGDKTSEAGYHGAATSSPDDGAVNLINNFDAGRQIQQSWYAAVGGSKTATAGENGYTRAYCYTGSTDGQYWPYNPVQAGDVVSNPGQIIDYEVNTAKGYIYVKARAMDWAKGYDASTNCANAVEGGVTTKSYMENYYRLNDDGTLIVNNSFIDWNGFTNMESCDYASIELPAVYPVHTLNYYVSYLGNDAWNGDNSTLTYDSTLTNWTTYPYIQNVSGVGTFDTEAQKGQSVKGKKLENWFAWANGSDENAFGMGMYIPNVMQFTSGRTEDTAGSTSLADECNRDALTNNVLLKKGLMSNMQAIELSYKSAYVTSTSYTAPGVNVRMEAYVPIEYSYVICLDTVANIRSKFQEIDEKGKITNAGNSYEKVGLDAWARADKAWTW